jgi:HSP20 family protein
MAEKPSDIALQEEKTFAPRGAFMGNAASFRMLERFAQEMDGIFEDFGVPRDALAPRFARNWARSPWRGEIAVDQNPWVPDIDVVQRNHDLVVRADLPGLRKDEVKVDVTNNAVIIQGERRHETEEERGGLYRSERGYGRFSRVIALPEGTITDHARASFKDGVLEITMMAPPDEVTRGRRLEITDSSSGKR